MPLHSSQNTKRSTDSSSTDLVALNEEIISCTLCPRLIAHCRKVGEVKRRAYLEWEYWAKPVPGFGDPNAYLNYLKRRVELKSKAGIIFGHGETYKLPNGRTLLCSYHPSLQNTLTGKLTEKMFLDVFRKARKVIG